MGTILVSGGTGFIGSHTCVELIEAGYDIAVFDNLSNSKLESLSRIEQICGVRPRFYEADMLDRAALDQIFKEENIEAVIHFAGFKAVGESVAKPWEYYHNNITGTLNLLDSMRSHQCKTMVFSSSATVYGDPAFVPITEDCPLGTPTNPYGKTKSMLESIMSDLCVSDEKWNISLLRYFNPIGAHKSGLIGEDPNGIPNNLMPYITQVALGKLERLGIFGDDYDTPDGTGIRDYIHVVDLAKGHVATLKATEGDHGIHIWNLGTGKGYSVFEVMHAFEAANDLTIPYEILPRREGDVAICYSSAEKAKKELGWVAELDLETMCRDSWNWQKNNPQGFEG